MRVGFGIIMKITNSISRKVLFEKFNIKHEMQDFLLSQLDGCDVKLLKDYPKSIFYVKDDIWLFWQDFKNKRLWVRYYEIWSVFSMKYKLKHQQIQQLITDTLDEPLKLMDLTPLYATELSAAMLDEPLKLMGLTPQAAAEQRLHKLDEPLKLNGHHEINS